MTARDACRLLGVLVVSLWWPVMAEEGAPPSDDFLEYLAMLVEEEGEWIDPLELEDVAVDDSTADAAGDTLIEDSQPAEETP